MRTKVTLFLLFLNVVLFFFIFHFERDWRTERTALEVRRRVLGPETAAIRSIAVASPRGGVAPFRLEQRSEESWFLTEPMEWPANLQAVHRIISDLQLLENIHSFSVRDVLKNGQSLASYGLNPPRLIVTLTSGGPDVTGAAAVTTTLRIGDTTKADLAAGEQSLYVLSPDGARIHVVGRELADSLAVPLDQLRSDSILTIPVYGVRSLSLLAASPGAPGAAPTPGLRVRLRADREGRWKFEAPIPDARADKDLTELAINGLDALRVKSFVAPPPPGPPPSAAPLLRVTIDGNERHETLFIGQPVDAGGAGTAAGGDREYYAQLEGRPAIFTVLVPGSRMATLSNAQADLRDRHVLDFDVAAVTAIALAAPSAKQPEITLQRLEAPAGGGTSWQIVRSGDGANGPQSADSGAVHALLSQLALLTAKTFYDAPQAADLENWGLNLPEREITLSLAAAPGAAPGAPLVLQIGVPTPRNDNAYARLPNAPSVYAVSPDILRETPVASRDWRDRLLPFLPAGAKITGLQITDLSRKAVLLEWKLDGGIVSSAAGAPAAGTDAAVQDLLRQLPTLRASRFVGDAFAEPVKDEMGESRSWRYRLDADLSLPAGAGGAQARTATLWFTERTSGSGQYAGSAEFNADFAIEQPLVDALFALTYGSRDPGPAPIAPPAVPAAAK